MVDFASNPGFFEAKCIFIIPLSPEDITLMKK